MILLFSTVLADDNTDGGGVRKRANKFASSIKERLAKKKAAREQRMRGEQTTEEVDEMSSEETNDREVATDNVEESSDGDSESIIDKVRSAADEMESIPPPPPPPPLDEGKEEESNLRNEEEEESNLRNEEEEESNLRNVEEEEERLREEERQKEEEERRQREEEEERLRREREEEDRLRREREEEEEANRKRQEEEDAERKRQEEEANRKEEKQEEEEEDKPSILQRMSNFMSKSPESEPEEVEDVESEPKQVESEPKQVEERYYEVDSNGEVISSSTSLDMSELIDSIEKLQRESHKIILSKQSEGIESLRLEMSNMMREVVDKSPAAAPSPTPEEPRLTRELLLETLAMNEDEKQNLETAVLNGAMEAASIYVKEAIESVSEREDDIVRAVLDGARESMSAWQPSAEDLHNVASESVRSTIENALSSAMQTIAQSASTNVESTVDKALSDAVGSMVTETFGAVQTDKIVEEMMRVFDTKLSQQLAEVAKQQSEKLLEASISSTWSLTSTCASLSEVCSLDLLTHYLENIQTPTLSEHRYSRG